MILKQKLPKGIIEINRTLWGDNLNNVNIEGEDYMTVSMPTGAANLNLGMPDIAHISTSIIIPDNGLMNFEIIDAQFIEYNNIHIAPSKGNLPRTVSPESINYEFDKVYAADEFYPNNIIVNSII